MKSRLPAAKTKARRGHIRSEAIHVGSSSPGKSGSCGVQQQEQRRTVEKDLEHSHSCHPHGRKSRWSPLSSSWSKYWHFWL